jgi:hypothetical protein
MQPFSAEKGENIMANSAKLVGPRPIYAIADEISAEWKKVYFGAVPYLEALHSLKDGSDRYGRDSAETVVVYFLSNAAQFRGPKARELKAELRSHFPGLR